MIPDLMVREAEHPKPPGLKLPIPDLIRVPRVKLLVLPPVQLNDQRGRPAVKIYSVFSNHPLPVPVQRVFFYITKNSCAFVTAQEQGG